MGKESWETVFQIVSSKFRLKPYSIPLSNSESIY